MDKLVIVVRRGCVESVLSSMPTSDLDVEVLDMDTEDLDEAEFLNKRFQEVRKIYHTDHLM